MNAYHVARGDKPEGPFTRAGIIDAIARGEIDPDTKLWRKGMADWAKASSFVEFAGHFTAREVAAAPPPANRAADGPAPTPRRLDMGRAVEDGLAAFRRDPWRACAGAGLYVMTVFAANVSLLSRLPLPGVESPEPPPGGIVIVPWLLGLLVVAVILRAGFCLFTLRLLRGEAVSPAVVFSGLRRFVVLIPFALFYGVAVFAGAMLMILPGIFLAVAYSLAFYIIMDGRTMPISAMRLSWRAVMALGWWSVFAVYLVSFLGVIALTLVSGVVGFLFGAPVAADIAQLVLVAAWAAVTALVIAAVYEQAKRNHGGFDRRARPGP